ncbi:hypothetical protein Trco_006070 [Trichoderma cornu-damae]|uniref:Apple domain-containing protein n=1 Tax=Trichoderma cornu-damae TaxID=654480 RepID=A0A9P8QQT1_9HYPO|nr:hypothetical protein Trco_006070 [Trichoderma cornu-damae]
MVKVRSVVSLLALSSNALAFGHQPGRQPVKEYVTCSTKLGPNLNLNVPTYWSYKTKTVTYTERLTTTPHPTVTPTKTETKSVTETVETVITEPVVTDVATTTVTGTSFSTTTNIVTEIVTFTTETTTTTTPTTTIPAPADFTPITEEPGYVARLKGRSVDSLLERGKETLQCKNGPGGPALWPPMHPQSVACTKVIEPIVIKRVTYTAKACTRTARPTTKTVTTTIKQTRTETVWPGDVTSTVTASTSTVITSSTDSTTTATTTTTSTVSAVAPLQTFQAACGPDNLITTANGGNGIAGVSTRQPGNFVPVSGITSPYECCVACFNTAACRGSLTFGPSACYLLVGADGVCHANQFNGMDQFQTQAGASGTTVSNGPCGLLANGGNA